MDERKRGRDDRPQGFGAWQDERRMEVLEKQKRGEALTPEEERALEEEEG